MDIGLLNSGPALDLPGIWQSLDGVEAEAISWSVRIGTCFDRDGCRLLIPAPNFWSFFFAVQSRLIFVLNMETRSTRGLESSQSVN